jgi:hypothetical protein
MCRICKYTVRSRSKGTADTHPRFANAVDTVIYQRRRGYAIHLCELAKGESSFVTDIKGSAAEEKMAGRGWSRSERMYMSCKELIRVKPRLEEPGLTKVRAWSLTALLMTVVAWDTYALIT